MPVTWSVLAPIPAKAWSRKKRVERGIAGEAVRCYGDTFGRSVVVRRDSGWTAAVIESLDTLGPLAVVDDRGHH